MQDLSPPEIGTLARDQFAAILGGLAEGVTVQDATARLVYANEAAARLTGYPSGEAMVAVTPDSARLRFT